MEPEKLTELEDNPVPDSEKTPKNENIEKDGRTEKQKETRRRAIFAAAGIALVAVGIGVGIKYSEHVKASPVATTTPVETTQASQTTSELITTTTESALTQKVESYWETMKKYNEMSVDEFEALPRDERLQYSQFIIDATISTDGYNQAYQQIDDLKAYAVEYTPVTKDNSGQEIIDNNLYSQQVSFLQYKFTEDSEKVFDTSDAIKCLSSVYYDVGDNNIVTNDYLAIKARQEVLETSLCMMNKNTATNTGDLVEGLDDNGDKIQYKIVTFDTESGETLNAKYILYDFINYDGANQAIWLLDNQSSKLENLTK